VAARDPFDVGSDLLHEVPPPVGAPQWANLGLWPPRPGGAEGDAGRLPTYPEAARALAERVGQAARLSPGYAVLDLACGEGASLKLWRETFGVARADGVELDPARAATAARAIERGRGATWQGPAMAFLEAARRHHPYDAVVCVDAAYHLASVAALARACRRVLPRDKRLAFTTLTWPHRAPTGPSRLLARATLRAAAIPAGAVLTRDALAHTLTAAGYQDVLVEPLDRDVLVAFAAHVARRRRDLSLAQRLSWRWLKVELTARLGRAGASSGSLGYALVSARRGP